MKSTRIAVFLLSGSAASVSAELNVAKMLILKDRANNNANTTSVLLGESNAGKGSARADLPSSRSMPLARLLSRTG